MTFSLSDFDIAPEASEVEMLDVDGQPTGIKLQVLSSNLDTVVEKLNAIEDARRTRALAREARAAKAMGSPPAPEPSAEIQDHFLKATAVRVAGWNLKEEASEANVVRLFKLRPGFAMQTLNAANDTARFTKASSKA